MINPLIGKAESFIWTDDEVELQLTVTVEYKTSRTLEIVLNKEEDRKKRRNDIPFGGHVEYSREKD